MASQANIPKLYRDILKAAKRFPSIKRNKILEEIKVEFHANKVSLAVCNALPMFFQHSRFAPWTCCLFGSDVPISGLFAACKDMHQ